MVVPRIHDVLKDLGHKVGENRVARIMRENGIAVLPRRGWRCLTTKADLGESNDTTLTLSALDRALELNNPPEGLVHHSDRGSNYTAGEYRQALSDRGIKTSMSRTRELLG